MSVIKKTIVSSEFTKETKSDTSHKGQKTLHNIEHNDHLAYFKKIEKIIITYDQVLLFGPTKAKEELHNLLVKDNRFNKIDVSIVKTDDLRSTEQDRFFKDYFSKKLPIQSS
jgi:hypothetical protein